MLAKETDPALLQMIASVIGNLALRLVQDLLNEFNIILCIDWEPKNVECV